MRVIPFTFAVILVHDDAFFETHSCLRDATRSESEAWGVDVISWPAEMWMWMGNVKDMEGRFTCGGAACTVGDCNIVADAEETSTGLSLSGAEVTTIDSPAAARCQAAS